MIKVKILFFLLLLWVFPLYAEPCGDINSDGSINIVDALLVAKFYVGSTPSNFDKNAADVSGDNKINIVDALRIAQFYVGLIIEIKVLQLIFSFLNFSSITPKFSIISFCS